MRLKVLITGGAGFIGAHLIRELQSHNVEVVVLDNFSTGNLNNLPPNMEIIEMDICNETIYRAITAGKFNAVVHLAGQTTVNESIRNPKLDAYVNIMGTINLLEAIRRSESIKRIIFASTAAVYGNISAEDLPIQETQPVNPMSFYALTKVTAENYLKLYRELFGINYIILRFSNAYGEHQGDNSESGVVSIFAKKIAKGENIIIYGTGKQTRDFIHAQDVASGIYHALITINDNEVYNISTQTEISLNELIATLEIITNKKISVMHNPARIGDINNSMLSNKRAIAKLNWKPEINLLEGLTRTFKYFEDL